MKHRGESGTVKGRNGKVTWTMSVDEAEEIADYLERSSVPNDVVMVDVGAIRAAIKDAGHSWASPEAIRASVAYTDTADE